MMWDRVEVKNQRKIKQESLDLQFRSRSNLKTPKMETGLVPNFLKIGEPRLNWSTKNGGKKTGLVRFSVFFFTPSDYHVLCVAQIMFSIQS